MSNLFLINHRSDNVEKLAVTGSSNLNLNLSLSRRQQNVLCLKLKEKCVTFCFILLNAKVSQISLAKG